MRIKELPPHIRDVAIKRAKEERDREKRIALPDNELLNEHISGLFNWSQTPEMGIWSDVFSGKYKSFNDFYATQSRFNIGDNVECLDKFAYKKSVYSEYCFHGSFESAGVVKGKIIFIFPNGELLIQLDAQGNLTPELWEKHKLGYLNPEKKTCLVYSEKDVSIVVDKVDKGDKVKSVLKEESDLLKERDKVTFIVGDKRYTGIICQSHISFAGESNSLVFKALGIDPHEFCEKTYGYKPESGSWPCFKYEDWPAINRTIKALQEECDKYNKTLVEDSIWGDFLQAESDIIKSNINNTKQKQDEYKNDVSTKNHSGSRKEGSAIFGVASGGQQRPDGSRLKGNIQGYYPEAERIRSGKIKGNPVFSRNV